MPDPIMVPTTIAMLIRPPSLLEGGGTVGLLSAMSIDRASHPWPGLAIGDWQPNRPPDQQRGFRCALSFFRARAASRSAWAPRWPEPARRPATYSARSMRRLARIFRG